MARSPIKRRSQRNKTTERAVSVGVGVDREEGLGLGGWTKFEKGGLGNFTFKLYIFSRYLSQ